MRTLIATVITVLVTAGCNAEQVAWKEISYAGPPSPVDTPAAPAALPALAAPAGTGCSSSIRTARAGSKAVVAWWVVLPDSSAQLVVARSGDAGATLEGTVIADSTDRGVRGCARPAPAIAIDSATGYVNIAYFAESPSGSGIFFAHSMDGGRSFHAPVPIVFGGNPASVAVAARDGRVGVAYEDPNSAQPSIGVALSRTMGHIFEHREIVSSDNEIARLPAIVLRGPVVSIWWTDYSPDPASTATRLAYREGVWPGDR